MMLVLCKYLSVKGFNSAEGRLPGKATKKELSVKESSEKIMY